jgi:outer membrane receptor protein involved in Fe transport
VSEALALRPGLWIDRGVAGTTGITLQGLGPRYSLILIDGARQIGRTDGYLDLDRFGVADIEQIEIVRGPSSALYGADALGGVVNLITRGDFGRSSILRPHARFLRALSPGFNTSHPRRALVQSRQRTLQRPTRPQRSNPPTGTILSSDS